MPFPFVARWIYEAERARCDRLDARIADLTAELVRMRHAGFTAAPQPVPVVEQPTDPEQRLLDDVERPLIERAAAIVRTERPDLSPAVAEREARRMLAELNGGTV